MPSFGAKLKQQREQRGMSLEEVSLTTKIGSRFLQALESDRFDQLPGGIFNKGFVRAYAKSIGIDEDEAVVEYLHASGQVPDQPEIPSQPPEIHAEHESKEGAGLPWGALAIVLVIVALALAVWGVYKRSRETKDDSPPTPASNQRTEVPATNPAPISAPGTITSPVPASVALTVREQKVPAPPSPTVVKPATAATKPALTLKIKAREDSWISITVDGEVATRNTMLAGSEKLVRADHDVTIKAGNVGALDFELNGKPVSSQGDIGEVKTLTFDGTGVHSAPAMSVAPSAQNGTPQP